MVECALDVMGRGASKLGLTGAEPIVTEYWLNPLTLVSACFWSGIVKILDALVELSVANSLVMCISVVL